MFKPCLCEENNARTIIHHTLRIYCLEKRNFFLRVKLDSKMLAQTTKTRVTNYLFVLGFITLSIGSVFWVINYFNSLQEYEEYCKMVKDQGLGIQAPYYARDNGKYINITLIALLFLWIPFSDHLLRKITYPIMKKKLTYRGVKRYSRSVSQSLHKKIYGLVLGYFMRVNRKVNAKIALWFMKLETYEHVHLLTKVFKWIVLPSNVLYGYAMYIFLGLNTLDSILWANLMFFYSNFVPDLPAIFRRKVYRDVRDSLHEELPQYKSYALLLLAPLFILILFCGRKMKWKATETFHNFKSLAIYGLFLFILGLPILLAFPITIGRTIEVIWVPFFALLGYLTHLKVDQLF
ncbi:MAG: hypothetical protein ACFFBD_24955 [Candidatus Hodarchaeota archaeon]